MAVAYHPAWLLKTNVVTHLAAQVDFTHIISDTYDAANRLAKVNGVAYTWDNNGNLLSDGALTTCTYNGLGDRLSQSVNGSATHYTLDLNAGLTQVLSDETNTYLYGNGRIAQYSGTTPGYFLGDALGSVRQMTDASGVVTLTRQYKPFGEVLSSAGSGTTVFGFDAEQTDSYIKLIYLRSRMYSPETRRFLSKDTWGGDSKIPMSYNTWLFVYGDPINFVDPSGYCVGCGYHISQVMQFESEYGVSIAGLRNGAWDCDPLKPLNGDFLAGIIDGVIRIGNRFTKLLGGSGANAFRQAFGNHTIYFNHTKENDFGLVNGYTVGLNPYSNVHNRIINKNENPNAKLAEGTFPFSRLVIHELGHVFDNNIQAMSPSSRYQPTEWLKKGIYEKDGRLDYDGYINGIYYGNGHFVTGEQNHRYNRHDEGSGFLGANFYNERVEVTGYQWHSYDEGGNDSVEDWADIFQNWVFQSFAPSPFGVAINEWVDLYMPVWINLANGKSLLPGGNNEH